MSGAAARKGRCNLLAQGCLPLKGPAIRWGMLTGVSSAKLKLDRIRVQIEEISALIRKLSETKDTYEIVKDANGKETLHFLIDAPSGIQIIAGEIVYQFRSALDHLAFQLVQSNPIRLPEGWEGRCQFPLHMDVPTHGRKVPIPYPIPVPYAAFKDRLPGISKEAYEFIESVQPYHSGQGVHNILRIIGRLANIDKHRHLYVLLPRIAVQHEFTYSDGFRGTSVQGGLMHGAEIPLEAPGGLPKRTFTPYVTFNEAIGIGPATLGTEHVFEVCLEMFRTVIIPTFEKLI